MTRPATRSRRRPLALLTAALATLALLATTAAASAHPRPHPPAAKPTIVLVHGAWADASSWDAVTAQLQREGYTVVAPPNPLRGLSADSAYLSAYLQQAHHRPGAARRALLRRRRGHERRDVRSRCRGHRLRQRVRAR